MSRVDEVILIHLHIPKSAGTSVGQVLRARFGDRLLVGPTQEMRQTLEDLSTEEADRRYDAVSGHVNWGVHRHFSRQFLYFSTIRDPIERICSYFNFIHRRPVHPLHSWAKRHLRSLDEITEAHFSQPGVFREWSNYLYNAYGDREGASVPEVVRHLSANVRSGRFVVGEIDGIDRFLADCGLLEDALPRWNVAPAGAGKDFERAAPAALTERARAILSDHNRLDLELLRRMRDCGMFYPSDLYPPIENICLYSQGRVSRVDRRPGSSLA